MTTVRALLASVCFLASAAHADVITARFGVPDGFTFHNFEQAGFRISPNCHADSIDEGIGFDAAGCPGYANTSSPWEGHNPNFLGPVEYQLAYGVSNPTPALYIDRNGERFDLLTIFTLTDEWHLLSSKGGLLENFDLRETGNTVTFSGPQWRGIEWLLFYIPSAPGNPYGFGDLTVRTGVPTPGTLSLLIFGVGLCAFRKLCRTPT